MWLLTSRDLRYRSRRVVVVIFAITLVFVLLFLMTGLVEQFNEEPTLSTDAVGATEWIVPAGVSGPFTSSATLTAGQVDQVCALAEVDELVVARGSLDGVDEVIVIGHEVDGIGAPEVADGRPAARAGELVVDESSGLELGASVQLGIQHFEVVGRSRDTTLLAGLPLVFLPIDDARRALFGGEPVVSVLLAAHTVDQLPPGVISRSPAEVADDARGPLENAIASIDLIRGLLWVVSGVVLGGVVFLTALERERDFAVLKAVGADNRALATGLFAQTVLMALTAVVLAAVVQRLVVPVFPLTVRVPSRAFAQIPLVAVAVSFVSAQAGLRRVRRSDPLIAFEGR